MIADSGQPRRDACRGCGQPGEVVGALNEHHICTVCEMNYQRFEAASKELEAFIAKWTEACQKRGVPDQEMKDALENAYTFMVVRLDERLPKAA